MEPKTEGKGTNCKTPRIVGENKKSFYRQRGGEDRQVGDRVPGEATGAVANQAMQKKHRARKARFMEIRRGIWKKKKVE